MQSTQHDIVIDPGLVRAKAYEIWQSMGCPEGAAEQTWLEAERQLKSRLAESPRNGGPSAAESKTDTAVPETGARLQSSRDSEPPPASDRMNHERDSETMATATGKPKKSAAGAKRSGRR